MAKMPNTIDFDVRVHGVPAGYKLVPIEAPESVCGLITGYGSDLSYMTERDRKVIVERGRDYWRNLLSALPEPAIRVSMGVPSGAQVVQEQRKSAGGAGAVKDAHDAAILAVASSVGMPASVGADTLILFALALRASEREGLSGETEAQREEVCAAWADLPDALRCHPGLKRLYRALGGVRMDEPGTSGVPGTPVADLQPDQMRRCCDGEVRLGAKCGRCGLIATVEHNLPATPGVMEAPAPSCDWREEDPFGNMAGTYESACGDLWAFTDGGPKENSVRFCHGCGKLVNVVPFPQPPEEADEDGVGGLDGR